jgi:hypothetical protein
VADPAFTVGCTLPGCHVLPQSIRRLVWWACVVRHFDVRWDRLARRIEIRGGEMTDADNRRLTSDRFERDGGMWIWRE